MHERRAQQAFFDATPQPPDVLARHTTDTGEIQLQRRLLEDGAVAYEIICDGVFLMSSQFHLGELALAGQALRRVERHVHADRRVLIGGLGMGFTLRETLRHAVARVDIVEISNYVIDWNRRFFATLNDRALSDPRVHLVQQDLGVFLQEATPGGYAAILLDVDNGPSWLVHNQNACLYTDQALADWAGLLMPGGVLAVWSAQAEPEFRERMKRTFRDVEEVAVPIPDPQGRIRNDYVYTGTR